MYLGDLEILGAVEYIADASQTDKSEIYVFYIILILIILVNCIVFMNFIVAEAGNTYNEVSEQLDNVIQQ